VSCLRMVATSPALHGGEALDDPRRQGFEVLPFCPFVNSFNSFIEEHREFVDLVPGSRREEFGL
jgi:hypothetical protein